MGRILSGGTLRESHANFLEHQKGKRLFVSNAWTVPPPHWVRYTLFGSSRSADQALRLQQCRGENFLREYVKAGTTPRGWNRRNYEDRAEELLKTGVRHAIELRLREVFFQPIVAVGVIVLGLAFCALVKHLRPEMADFSPFLVIVAAILANGLMQSFVMLSEGRLSSRTIARVVRFVEVCGLLAGLAVYLRWISAPLTTALALGLMLLSLQSVTIRLLYALSRPARQRRIAAIMPAIVSFQLAKIYHACARHQSEWPDVELTNSCVNHLKTIAFHVRRDLPSHLGDGDSIPFRRIADSLAARYLARIGDVASGGGRKALQTMTVRDLGLVVAGHWAELAGEYGAISAVEEKSRARVWKRLVVALAPLAATGCIRIFNVVPVEQSATLLFVSILWPAVVIIITLEPNAKRYFDFISQFRSAVKAESKEAASKEEI